MGRADELAELVALLDAALDGRSGFAVIAGEPGIGKTRLAEELAALAGARAVPVLWGGCTAAEGAPAYWPWRRILRSWLAVVGPDRAAAAMAGFGEVARLAPELPGEPVESDRFALFDAVARFLVAVAEEAGLVLVLDDVQWADADSLALLAHVTREVTRGRLLVVATVRPAERDLALGGLVIELFGWDDAEVGAALGGVPDPDFVAAVARRSGGNPFFVGELVRAGTAALRVPSAVRDVVRARIRRLPEPCRALLGAAAVLGRDVDAALLSAVTGVGGVLDDLRPALDDGVLDHPAGRVGLRFTHDLVRESVLADLATAEQARVHLAVVAALTPSADDPDVVAELAHHALAALPAGDRVAATGWARRAAEVAHSRLAYDEAARLLADALAAGRPVLSPAERLSVLLELARARGLAHDVAGAIATFTEAAELARATGDAAGLACAALGLPEVSEGTWLDAVRGWCEEALRGLGDGDSPLKARLLAQVAHSGLFGGGRAGHRRRGRGRAGHGRTARRPGFAVDRAAGTAARPLRRRRQRRAARARRPHARARRAHRRPGGRSVGQALAFRRAAAGGPGDRRRDRAGGRRAGRRRAASVAAPACTCCADGWRSPRVGAASPKPAR